ncbi:unnamed protein product, partial [marine sediment metagenome]
LLRSAKIDVDATGQMLYMNDNVIKNQGKNVKLKEFLDSMADANSSLFPDVTSNKTTPFQKSEAMMTNMDEMNYPISQDEWDDMDFSGIEYARNSAFFADIGIKIMLFNKAAGALGITQAVKGMGSMAKLKTAKFLSKAGKGTGVTAYNLGKLSEHAIMAGYEETMFQIIEGTPGTGAMFYGANQMLAGAGDVAKQFGNKNATNLGGVIRKNKKFGLLLRTLARTNASMAASMEMVSTTEAVVDGWIHDKKIGSELEELWGAESDWD